MDVRHLIPLLLAATLLAACGEGRKTPEPAAPVDQGSARAVPDVGGVRRVEVTTTGRGMSMSEAMTEAMKLAVLEVNGAVVDTATLTMKLGLDVTDGKDAASLRGSAFADLVAQSSGGVIQSLKVVEATEPGLVQKLYAVTINAAIAKFEPSAEMQRIRVVVATPQFDDAPCPWATRRLSHRRLPKRCGNV